MRQLTRTLVPIFALSLILSGPAIAQTAIPQLRPGTDITQTPAGQRMIREAVERYSRAGVDLSAAGLKVLDLGADGLLVAPEHAMDIVASLTGAQTASPSMETSATVGSTLAAPAGVAMAAEGDAQLAAAAYWSRREGGCFSRKWVDSAWLDSCYEISRLINDNDSTKDFFSLEHWAYIGETQFGLRHAWINGFRAAGTQWQTWYRASPGSDISGSCRDVPVTLTVLQATVGSVFRMCEAWDMTKSANGSDVSYKNQWQCNCSFMIGGNREVAYTIVVTVPAGKSPVWTLGWGMAA